MKTLVHILIVTALLSLSANAAQEVWITPIGTDGNGVGTVANPYIRTTAASFDALINSATIPADTTIHLMAGTFKTAQGITQKANWKIRGAGIGITTVQMDSSLSPPTWALPVIGYPCCYRLDGVEVSDLTVDCNLQNISGAGCITAVRLQGSENRISRVKAINWGSKNGSECFILSIGAHWVYSAGLQTNCVIEDCIVGPAAQVTHTQGATAITIIGGNEEPGPYTETPGDGWIVGAEIRDCVISGISTGTSGNPVYFNGIGMASVLGGKVAGNRVMNVQGNAIAASCGSIINYTIENNMLVDVYFGIVFADRDVCGTNRYRKENIQVINNLVSVKDGGIGIQLSGFWSNTAGLNNTTPLLATNVVAKNNFVQNAGSGALVGGMRFFRSDEVTFEDNIVDANGGTEFYYDNTAKFSSIRNNKTTSGAGLSQPGPIADGQDQCIVFQPTGAGWYRLTQYNWSFGSAHVSISRDADVSDNSLVDLEFDYVARAYTSDPNYVGDITLLRCQDYGGGGVTQIRVGNDNPTTADTFLDIYLATFPAGRPITIKVTGGKNHQFVQSPQFLGNPGTPPPIYKTLAIGRSLKTTGTFFAGGTATIQGTITAGSSAQQITDSAGKLMSSALTGTVAPAQGGLGLNASGEAANRFPYTTATGTFGFGDLTSFTLGLLDDPDAAAARSTLGFPGTPTSGAIPVGNGLYWGSLGPGAAGKALVLSGSSPIWGDALQEAAEANNTPVTDTASTAVGATTLRLFDFVTLPTSERLYVITGIEWKNGTTVAGNTICGAVLVNANPPTQTAVPTVAFGQLTANSGASSIQRVSGIVSQPIRGGTAIGIFVQADNTTHTYRTATVTSANNRKTVSAFPSGGDVPNQENAAWTASTTKAYLKVYYRGYK